MASKKKVSARGHYGDCQTCGGDGTTRYRSRQTCQVCNGTHQVQGWFLKHPCRACDPDGKVGVYLDRRCVTCKGEGKIKFLILRGACPSCCGRKAAKKKLRGKKCRTCRGKKTVRIFYPVRKCSSCDGKRTVIKRCSSSDCDSCRSSGMMNCDGSPIAAMLLVAMMDGNPLLAGAVTALTGSTFAGVAVGVLSAGSSQDVFLSEGVVEENVGGTASQETDDADTGTSEVSDTSDSGSSGE